MQTLCRSSNRNTFQVHTVEINEIYISLPVCCMKIHFLRNAVKFDLNFVWSRGYIRSIYRLWSSRMWCREIQTWYCVCNHPRDRKVSQHKGPRSTSSNKILASLASTKFNQNLCRRRDGHIFPMKCSRYALRIIIHNWPWTKSVQILLQKITGARSSGLAWTFPAKNLVKRLEQKTNINTE